MSHADGENKTLDDLHEDAGSGLMWMRVRVRKMRAGFDDAQQEAERVAREVGILRDFLVQGDLLEDDDREKVETLHDHILKAYDDLCSALDDGKGAGTASPC